MPNTTRVVDGDAMKMNVSNLVFLCAKLGTAIDLQVQFNPKYWDTLRWRSKLVDALHCAKQRCHILPHEEFRIELDAGRNQIGLYGIMKADSATSTTPG